MRKYFGWIIILREICRSAIWNWKEPFDKRSAWIDLLIMANFKDSTLIKRGEILTSYGELAERWRWDKSKVWRYMKQLEEMGLVIIRRTENGTSNRKAGATVITIRNYENYQTVRNDEQNGSCNEPREHHNKDIPGAPDGASGEEEIIDPELGKPVITWED